MPMQVISIFGKRAFYAMKLRRILGIVEPKLSKVSKTSALQESQEELGGTLLYNLSIIKVGLQVVRLKMETKMDEKTLSEFSKVERILSQLTEEILEFTILREKLVN